MMLGLWPVKIPCEQDDETLLNNVIVLTGGTVLFRFYLMTCDPRIVVNKKIPV